MDHSSAAEPLRVGLVGCSWFALRAHIPALLALEQGGCRGFSVRIEAVCSRTRKSMAKAEAKIGRPCEDRGDANAIGEGSMQMGMMQNNNVLLQKHLFFFEMGKCKPTFFSHKIRLKRPKSGT